MMSAASGDGDVTAESSGSDWSYDDGTSDTEADGDSCLYYSLILYAQTCKK